LVVDEWMGCHEALKMAVVGDIVVEEVPMFKLLPLIFLILILVFIFFLIFSLFDFKKNQCENKKRKGKKL
jgi:uncharacterized membrane protein